MSDINASTSRENHVLTIVAKLIVAIDDLIISQLSLIYKHPCFVALASSWKGISWLVETIPATERTIIKCFDASFNEISEDFTYSAGLSQSTLYKRICMEELDTLGGSPFGLILADFHFDFFNKISPKEEEFVRLLSDLGECSLCPFILGLGKGWLEYNDDLAFSTTKIERIKKSDEYKKYQKIRDRKSSCFLLITWPNIFLKESHPVRNNIDTYNTKIKPDYFFHCGYALLAITLREYNESGWFSGLLSWGEGTNAGCLLPSSKYRRLYAEYKLTEMLEFAYADLGITPLYSSWLESKPGFFILPTCHSYQNDINQSLPSLLIVSRFAHYLKSIVRDHLGGYNTAEECRKYLIKWINYYCNDTNILSLEFLSRHPLKKASIEIKEDLYEPDKYQAYVALTPNMPACIAEIELSIHIQLSSSL